MEQQDVVRELTKKGIIVTPEMFRKLREDGGPTTTPKQLAAPGPRTKLSVRTRVSETVERVSPEDFTTHYNNRYTRLKDVLLKKMDAVSISNVGGGFSEVSGGKPFFSFIEQNIMDSHHLFSQGNQLFHFVFQQSPFSLFESFFL